MKGIFKVVAQGEPFVVQSQKAENGQLKKSILTLQEIGGKYENTYAVTLLGGMAEFRFYPGECVFAALHFAVREYNGQVYQDIVVIEIIKVKS